MRNVLERKSSNQITKAKQLPIWVGGDFKRFRREVKAWEKGNKDEQVVKYYDFMESLKKNCDVKDYAVTVI